jgi:hypothetical protein
MSREDTCIGQPISWLMLERYHARELGEDERSTVEAHLAACPACLSCWSRIEADQGVALPPLPVAERRTRRRVPAAMMVGAVALAAALLLWARRHEEPTVATSDHTKGDGVSFSLMRESETRVPERGATYANGERFKGLVTCPPGKRAWWDLAVIDPGTTSFPLAASEQLACGNDVPLTGAFRLTGNEPLSVCLLWSDERTIDRGALAHASKDDFIAADIHALCNDMEPAH